MNAKQELIDKNQENYLIKSVPIIKMARALGFRVYRQDFTINKCTSMSIIQSNIKNIYVNSNCTNEEHRFSVAYELAYYMHAQEKEYEHTAYLHEDLKNQELKPLLLHAAHLMLPELSFAYHWCQLRQKYNYQKTIDHMVKCFCVPREAIIMRAIELKY